MGLDFENLYGRNTIGNTDSGDVCVEVERGIFDGENLEIEKRIFGYDYLGIRLQDTNRSKGHRPTAQAKV
jgi:hypothetical protein